LPIIEDGELIGAIGVSGSSVENDHAVAAAGVKVLGHHEIADHPFARMMQLRAQNM
jgi:heme-degrading protein